MMAPDPVLDAIVASAVGATGAAAGWLLDIDGDDLVVVGAAGPSAGELLGQRIPGEFGSAGYVVASGQPLAVTPRPGESGADGVATLAGLQPTSVLCVPCATEMAVLGALELVNKAGGGAFSFEDVEMATLLAEVAGPALAHRDATAVEVPKPEELSATLARLAAVDPGRYARVATFVRALLDQT